YFFTIYALDRRIEGDLNKGNFRQKVEEHTIARAEIMGRYARQQ
ncbi:MAG: YbhB/YbcL family Raf kinase inhibitor-like protein, partial [Candidatus Hydrothermota bacterium]